MESNTHIELLAPQDLSGLSVYNLKIFARQNLAGDPAFPLGLLLDLPLGLLLLAWNDSYMAPGIWLAPFFF